MGQSQIITFPAELDFWAAAGCDVGADETGAGAETGFVTGWLATAGADRTAGVGTGAELELAAAAVVRGADVADPCLESIVCKNQCEAILSDTHTCFPGSSSSPFSPSFLLLAYLVQACLSKV